MRCIVDRLECSSARWLRAPTLPCRRQNGAAEYLSVTVFEGATTQDLLEFFVDDAHRITWDDLLAGYEVLEADPCTGAEVGQRAGGEYDFR